MTEVGAASPACEARPRARGHLGRSEIAISAREISGGLGSVVRNLSLDIVRGQITVVCGAAGAGKTALLRLLAGLDGPGNGAVWIGDRQVAAGPGRPQLRFRRDELAFVGEHRDAPAGHRGAAVMNALAPDPALAFIDEPAAGLSPAELDRLHSALYALTAICGRTAVVATRNPQVATWADRLVVLDRGALILDLDSPTPVEVLGALAAVAG